jgi:hypothetical protein
MTRRRRAASHLIPVLVAAASNMALGLLACTAGTGSPPSSGDPSPGNGALPDQAPTVTSPSSPTSESPAAPGATERDLSSLSSWCPSCSDAPAEGGDTTDFGGNLLVPQGCSNDVAYSEMTVAQALASDVDLSRLPVGLDEQFQANVSWREQSRSSRVTVSAHLNDRVKTWHQLPLDAGSSQHCTSWVQGSVNVKLETDDGSISGSFDTDRIFDLEYDQKLFLGPDWSSAIQLQGNLALTPDLTRTPARVQLQFVWYRVAPGPGDRIGIAIVSYFKENKATPECGGAPCNFQTLAFAVPTDGCLPRELPLNGACVPIETHPEYGAPPAVHSDAGPPSVDGGL